ncbi:MAG: valine--tRNA ligase [Lachnospiraceae bacterium]|nr:valine--tRNA ligase [Lachnospiraceae bacterium]
MPDNSNSKAGKELAKTYNPSEIEDRIYKKWLDKKYFHAEVDETKKPFTIVIPPPNITGQLHMGHALDNTMQDILIRTKRMQGYNALWQPGTDHASIATEAKIVEALKKEGISKEDLGREKFLERAWAWRKEYGGRIVEQLKKLGSSCDWDRERFTMDEGCNKAVNTVFTSLYKKGLIYKGSRIVNWCPVCNTSISDAEVEYEEQAGHFWHIKYPLIEDDGSISKEKFLIFATTRPETMLGDTAVAVNPEDERYKDLVGKTLWLPFVDRKIPIIADSYVDMTFGTGVVKITPAHDPNDFEVGKRHNLPEINILNDDATINENGGKFKGLDRYEARKQIVKELDEMGLLVKIEEHSHNVGTCYRCHTTVEPMIKKQWFVKMDELIKPAVEAVKTGDIKLIPERMEKTYFNWTDNIRDWCISRQLWWGHQIPAYYCADCGHITVSGDKVEKCEKCGSTHIERDPDTLDTWFSSALWPFSTLGWPEDTKELKYFYPTDVLVTGYDIIFFWVIRMIFSGFEQMGERPFKTVLFHGLVRDDQGRKMSKSLGNGIDPLEIIEKYGADALRFTLITGNAPGNDMRFYMSRVEASRNFANKVWNASRFIMMNMDQCREAGIDIDFEAPLESVRDILEDADRWILSKAASVVAEVTDSIDKFELGIAAQKIYDFIWEELCDWYIEMVKARLYGDDVTSKKAAMWTLSHVLVDSLKLLHPYMPFITEEIFCTLKEAQGTLGKNESIMIAPWPEVSSDVLFPSERESVELIKEAVKAIRALRVDMNVPLLRKAAVHVVSEDAGVLKIFENSKNFFASLCGASEVFAAADKTGLKDDAVSSVIPGATIYIPLEDLVDLEKERERLVKEKARLEGELKRVNGMLSNPNFVNKAPAAKLEEEKAKLEKYTDMYEKVTTRLEQLK